MENQIRYNQLRPEERMTVASMKLQGASMRAMARVLGRPEAALAGFTAKLNAIAAPMRPKEMARHAELAARTDIRVYFCDPHSPWRRGTCENTNGLLRQYLPKDTDLSIYS